MARLILIILIYTLPKLVTGQLSRPPGLAHPLEKQYVKPIEMAGVIKSVTCKGMYRENPDFDSPLVFGGKDQVTYNRLGLVQAIKIWDAGDNLTQHISLNYNDSLTQFVQTVHIRKYGSDYVSPLEIWESDTVCWQIDTVSNKIIAKYEYSNGVIQRLINYGGDTSIIERMDLFDSLGNRIYKEENILSLSIHSKEYWRYTYDEKGNILSCLKTNKDGSAVIEEQRYTYDELNRKLTYSYVGLYWDAFTKYDYNEQGYLILMTRTGSDPATALKAIYSYDKYWNLISEVVFVGDVDTSRKTWTIEYFD